MDLQQQLMEFVYGLLDEDEANALIERITSDPDVARAYSKVKLQCDLVQRAAKIDEPTVAWVRPDGTSASGSKVKLASQAGGGAAVRRLANWCVALSACILIGLVSASLLDTRVQSPAPSAPVMVASASPMKVVVTGPSKLHAEADNPFTVRVANEAGTPVSTTLNYAVYDSFGSVRLSETRQTDSEGFAHFEIDPSVASDAKRLEVTTSSSTPTEPLERSLESMPEQHMAYLRMDRPLYQPGEQIFFRSVALSQLALRADRELHTSFGIVDGRDQQVLGASLEAVTDQGVANGNFKLPDDLADGEYTLIARSPNQQFREEWRDFRVQRFATPKLNKKLELAKDSYTVGEQVDVDFSVERVAGTPISGLTLDVQAKLDGVALDASKATTDENGKSRILLKLPDAIERGEASISVTVQDGELPPETITKNIPINVGKVNVDFFPEGGELAEGLPSRVYFYGRDPLGNPVHVEGSIVDSADNQVADVVTIHEGRGVFSFTPAAGQRYRLAIDKPAGVTKQIELPAATRDQLVAINAGRGVFEENSPIHFTLHQRVPVLALNVSAYCRGAMVAQQPIDAESFASRGADYATFAGELALPDQAQGVIRLTVFDATNTPPLPIAERLVYRSVGRKLNVQINADSETFAPGQAVQLDLVAQDETNAPVPAVLGISIVDDAVLNLAEDKSTRMPTYFHLLSAIDSAHRLEDANFYLSDEPDSRAALDSLLGTQGWRTFTKHHAMQFAQSGEAPYSGMAGGLGLGGGGLGNSADAKSSWRFRSVTWSDDGVVPVSTVASLLEKNVSIARSNHVTGKGISNLLRLRVPIVATSVVLLLLVAVTSMFRAKASRSIRAAGLVIAMVSLTIALFSLPHNGIPRIGATADRTSSTSEVANFSETLPSSAGAVEDLPDAGASIEAFESAENRYLFDEAKQSKQQLDAPMEAPAAANERRFGSAEQLAASDDLDAPARQLGMARKKESPEPEAEAMPSKAEIMKGNADYAAPAALPPRPKAAARSNLAEPAAEPMVTQSLMLDDLPQLPIVDSEGAVSTRRFAKWFYDPQRGGQTLDQASSTIFWHPKFVADSAGKATVYFNLPERSSTFRVIVEAHGTGRLGVGELLIDSVAR